VSDPDVVVGVGGCWAQSVKEQVFEQFPFVDVAFGPGQVHKLAEFLTSDSLTAQGYFEFDGFTGHLPAHRERPVPGVGSRSAWAATAAARYCIVPVHPRARGQPPARDARRRASARSPPAGVREVTLLGQNVNAYAARPSGRSARASPSSCTTWTASTGLAAPALHEARIRRTCAEDVVRAHAELASVCEHIHLPLQSGSSRILKAMRRTYDRDRYLDRVRLIREHVPDAALTTDIIVGFPGETEEDFAATLALVEEVGYDGAFTFIFSPRRGTEGRRAARRRAARGQGGADGAAGRGRPAPRPRARSALRGAHAGGARRGSVPHRRGAAARPHAPQQGRELRGPRLPGDLVEVEIHEATSQTLAGEERAFLLAQAG
jgi:tRNA-2-methylthio-N6-dimethylallyladenosine synthase